MNFPLLLEVGLYFHSPNQAAARRVRIAEEKLVSLTSREESRERMRGSKPQLPYSNSKGKLGYEDREARRQRAERARSEGVEAAVERAKEVAKKREEGVQINLRKLASEREAMDERMRRQAAEQEAAAEEARRQVRARWSEERRAREEHAEAIAARRAGRGEGSGTEANGRLRSERREWRKDEERGGVGEGAGDGGGDGAREGGEEDGGEDWIVGGREGGRTDGRARGGTCEQLASKRRESEERQAAVLARREAKLASEREAKAAKMEKLEARRVVRVEAMQAERADARAREARARALAHETVRAQASARKEEGNVGRERTGGRRGGEEGGERSGGGVERRRSVIEHSLRVDARREDARLRREVGRAKEVRAISPRLLCPHVAVGMV